MSLRARFSVTIASLVVLAVAGAASLAWYSSRAELRDQLDEDLVARLRPLAAAFSGPRGAPPLGLPDYGRRGLLVPADVVPMVIDERGEVVATVDGDPALPIGDELLALASGDGTAEPVLLDVTVEGEPWRLAAAPLRAGGAVAVARDVSDVEAVLTGLRRRLLLVALLSAGAAAGAGWLLARRETEPLEQLTAAAEHVASTRDLATPIDVQATGEVARLASSFDTMLSALATSLDQQRRLIQDAGHELRTPLTSLRTNIEVLRKVERLPVEDRAKIMDDLGLELAELSELVDELMVLAAEDPDVHQPRTQVQLDVLVRAAAERLQRRSGREVVVTAEPTSILGVPSALERAVGNLLGNADKFSADGTPIEVQVTEGSVRVRDHGPGIAPEDRPHVFDRFYRSSSARSAPGSGLGLAIVRQVVEAHGGSCFVEEPPGGGAVVGFTVPADGPPR